MPYISFTFNNTNEDQSFSYVDEKDPASGEHNVGPVNHGDTSSSCQCWQGSDGRGSIVLTGSIGPSLHEDIGNDGYNFDY